MKFVAAFFFIGVFPIIVFLVAVLHGGLTPNTLKKSLSESNVYTTLPNLLRQSADEGGDDSTNQFMSVIQEKFGASYIKSKTEKLIDDTDLWVRGKTDASPVVSFSEIKDQLTSSNPELLNMMKQGMQDMKAQAQESGEALPVNNQAQEFFDNGMTVKIGDSLKFVKDGYRIATIALPILFILAALSLIVIIAMSPNSKSRFKWLGIVLIISAFYGFIWVFTGNLFFAIVKAFVASESNQAFKMIAPIFMKIVDAFYSHYKLYQMQSGMAFLIGGVVLFIVSVLQNDGVTPVSAPVKSTKKKK